MRIFLLLINDEWLFVKNILSSLIAFVSLIVVAERERESWILEQMATAGVRSLDPRRGLSCFGSWVGWGGVFTPHQPPALKTHFWSIFHLLTLTKTLILGARKGCVSPTGPTRMAPSLAITPSPLRPHRFTPKRLLTVRTSLLAAAPSYNFEFLLVCSRRNLKRKFVLK